MCLGWSKSYFVCPYEQLIESKNSSHCSPQVYKFSNSLNKFYCKWFLVYMWVIHRMQTFQNFNYCLLQCCYLNTLNLHGWNQYWHDSLLIASLIFTTTASNNVGLLLFSSSWTSFYSSLNFALATHIFSCHFSFLHSPHTAAY